MAPKFLLSTLFLLPTTLAHMQMTSPSPFRDPHSNRASEPKDYDILNPLYSDGSNFACKGYHLNTPWTSVATYEAGGTYSMDLAGSATHGGGSCQLSFSCDGGQNFKVVHSIIGGCPLQKSYDFTVPSEFGRVGGATCLFAWTWINKIGNREMYMNCAVVDIVPRGSRTQTGTRRNVAIRDTAKVNAAAQDALSSYPDLFVANLASINECVALEALDVVFDDPGSSVLYGDDAAKSRKPSFNRGACRGKGQKTASTSSSSSSSPPAGGSSSGNDGQWRGGNSQQPSTSKPAINPNDGQWHPEIFGGQNKNANAQSPQNQQASKPNSGINPNDGQWHPQIHGKRRDSRQKRWGSYEPAAVVSNAVKSSPEADVAPEPDNSSKDLLVESPVVDTNLFAFLERLDTLTQSIFTLVKYGKLYLDPPSDYDRSVTADSADTTPNYPVQKRDSSNTIPTGSAMNTGTSEAKRNSLFQYSQYLKNEAAQLQQYLKVTATTLDQTADRQPIQRRQLIPLTSADLVKPINPSSLHWGNTYPELQSDEPSTSTSTPTPQAALIEILEFFLAILANNTSNNNTSNNNTSNNNTSPPFPYFLSPGPFIPPGLNVSPPTSNLENLPPLTNDLGPEDEDSVREFFANLGKDNDTDTNTNTTVATSRLAQADDVQDPDGDCLIAEEMLAQRLDKYRAQLMQGCETVVGGGFQTRDVMNRFCMIRRQSLVVAIAQVEMALYAGCEMVLAFTGWG